MNLAVFQLLKLLVLFIPVQLGKHFWPNFSFVRGARIDYLSPTVYLTDLIVLLILALFFVKNKTNLNLKKQKVFVLGLIVFQNIVFSIRPTLTLYYWLRVLVLVMLFVVFKSYKSQSKQLFWPIFFSQVYSFLIGSAQFLKQTSLNGFFYWLGERPLSLATPGVAKEVVFNKVYLPAYATFSHPNSFAGFLGLSFIVLLFLFNKSKLNFYKKTAMVVSFVITVFGVLMTGSVVAVFALILVGVARLALYRIKVKKNQLIFLKTLIFSSLVLVLFDHLILSFLPKSSSVIRRLNLNKVAFMALLKNPFFGVGIFNFIPFSSTQTTLVKTWLQPVHNVFYLIFSEIGLVGLLAVGWCYRSLKKSFFKKDYAWLLGLVFVLFTSSFDHYWLTLQQNRILLILFLSLA